MIELKKNIKKYFIYITIIVLCLLLLNPCNATSKKDWFGNEKRCELDDFSVAEIEGFDIKANDNNLVYYTGPEEYLGSPNMPKIYVSMKHEEDFDVESWKEKFLVTSYSILKEETINGLTISFYHTKSPSIYGGAEGYDNYVTIGMGEKDGHLFYMDNEVWNAGDQNDTYLNEIYSQKSEVFVEIFNSIEINN